VNNGTGIEHLVYTGSSGANLTGNVLSNSITGGSENDILTGTSRVGSSEIDTLTGGAGADRFVLAGSGSLFYNFAAAAGDYALITDFSVADDDTLQLLGGTPYVFAQAPVGGGTIGNANTYLYRDNDANGTAGAGDNLIAAIVATGGTGPGGSILQAELNSVATFVS
jgi:Ca2+-binding RTX toxin-like protein